jgi:hypothetical protein
LVIQVVVEGVDLVLVQDQPQVEAVQVAIVLMVLLELLILAVAVVAVVSKPVQFTLELLEVLES